MRFPSWRRTRIRVLAASRAHPRRAAVRSHPVRGGVRGPGRRAWARAPMISISVLLVWAGAASALSPPHIYWTDDPSTIGRSTLDGSAVQRHFIVGAELVAGLVVDGRHVYWTNAHASAIGRANLDGTGIEQRFITGLRGLSAIAVDRRHVYWSGVAGDGSPAIGRANLDGTDVDRGFITGLEASGLAVDGRHLFWVDFGADFVGRADLDGGGVDPRFITGASLAWGVAVDGQHIYWTNAGTNTIGEANLDGHEIDQRFITGAKRPRALTVDGEHIFWTNVASKTIGEAHLDGTAVDQRFITDVTDASAVAVSVPALKVAPEAPPPFATTPVGRLSAPLTLTISNSGQRNLSITGLSFSGANPGDFIVSSNTCLGQVVPGESCHVTVNFAPRDEGRRSTALEIDSNDVANSPLPVPLSGTGGTAARGDGTAGGKLALLRRGGHSGLRLGR